MIEKVKSIIRTKTFSQTLITSSGTIVNGILGLFFYILMARFLGPANYGIFSISVTFIALLASISNIGIDTGIVRFVGRNIKGSKKKALRFLKLAIQTKIITSLVVLVVGWVLVPFVCQFLLKKQELIIPLRMSLLGVATSLLFSFTTSSAQALQKFWLWSGLNIFSNFLRLATVVLLFKFGLLNLEIGLSAYIFFPFVGFLLGIFFLPNFWKVRQVKQVSSEFFNYNKWIAMFTLIAAFSGRMDTFISTRLLSFKDVGIYSVALNLTSIIPELVLALATVVAPKLASFSSNETAKKYLVKLQIFVLGLAVLGLMLGIPLGRVLIHKLYGANYFASISPLIILIVAQAIFLISIPAHTSIFYYFSYPKLFVYVAFFHLLITGVGGYLMINTFGYMGAAYAVLIGNVFNFVVPAFWVLKKFNKD